MFNNIFCEINIQKVIHWGGDWRNGVTVLISFWKGNFSIYLDIQVYYLYPLKGDIKKLKKLIIHVENLENIF